MLNILNQLQKLFSLMRDEKKSLSRDRIAGNAITLFMAGTDTTQTALVDALYLLASDHELQEELRQEVMGFDWESASYDDLFTKTPRLKSFLHEVHRWYAFPNMMLETQAEIPFCGTKLAKGQSIFILMRYSSTQSHSPSKDVPQENPHEFNPRRYLVTEDGQLTCPNPSAQRGGFLAFGHGVRSCPGRRYSELLSYCVLIATLQTFRFELDCPVKIIYDSVMMSPDKPVKLKMSKL